jgi:hypothetical protein
MHFASRILAPGSRQPERVALNRCRRERFFRICAQETLVIWNFLSHLHWGKVPSANPGKPHVTKKRILILRGGFGGVYVAVHLGKMLSPAELEGTEIALVNRDNYIVF